MARAATRILCSLSGHVRRCHSNTLGDSELLAKALEKPGMDFKHWFAGISFGDSRSPNRKISIEERIDFYIKTLAKVVGSEEEAKKRIYKIDETIDDRSGFGCEIDWETSNLLEGLHHVDYVTPDFYADPENEDYGGKFSFINGRLFERSSMRMLPVPPISSVLEKPWTQLLLRPNPSPWLLLEPPAGEEKVYRFYSVSEMKEFCIKRNEEEEEEDEFVGSSHGWLASFRRHNGQLYLSNPLLGQHMKLPSFDFGEVGKVIVSCSPNVGDQCRAVMIFGSENRLAFCCPGRSQGWTLIGGDSYSDVVYSNRQGIFLCLTDSGGLEGWNLSDQMYPRMVEEHRFDTIKNDPMKEVIPVMKPRIHELKHLVLDDKSEEVFVVVRQIRRHQSGWGYYVESRDPIYPYKTWKIKMYKIDKERKECLCCGENESNGLAMFVGTNHSFALQASRYPDFDRNSIFYTDEKRLIPPGWAALPFGAPDIDVYNYKHNFFYSGDHGKGYLGEMKKCKYPYACDGPNMRRVPPLPIWFTPTFH